MGIHTDMLDWLQWLPLPAGFEVCELGDQFVTQGEGAPYLAYKWYERRGCSRYVSIDANGANDALAVDLNLPIASRGSGLANRFDLVTDFGTGEHIFNQAQVWRSMHAMAKQGALLVFDRPTVGYEGHCFYLIQWNLISALAHANNYEVLRLEEKATSRGILLRGVLRKRGAASFEMPQQGRYVPKLKVKMVERGPDWKSAELRQAGVVGRRKK